MKNARFLTKVSLLIILTAVSGCGQNKEKSGQASPLHPGESQSSQGATAMSPQKNGAVAAAKDEADAAMAKEQVIKLLKGSDFSTIYKQASAGFRQVGSEQQFVALWLKQLQETGPFKEAKQIGHTIRPADKFLLFTYQVKYANMSKELSLTFGRSKSGKLELTGIHQKQL